MEYFDQTRGCFREFDRESAESFLRAVQEGKLGPTRNFVATHRAETIPIAGEPQYVVRILAMPETRLLLVPQAMRLASGLPISAFPPPAAAPGSSSLA